MSRIKSKDTGPELIVRKALFKKGFRFRIHQRNLPGKPDIVLKKHSVVILIHGCFWHGHENCKYFVIPKTRTEWWLQKISRNRELDGINEEKLKLMNWNVINIYECQLKKNTAQKTLEELIKKLTNK